MKLESWTTGLLMLALVIVVAQPAVARAEEEDGMKAPTLTVNGSGEVWSDPDEATIRLGILVQESAAGAAQARANEVANRILEALEQAGVPEKAIRTSELRLSPVYNQPQPRPTASGESNEPRIVAYRASNTVSVRLEDLSKVGPAIDAGLRAGANQVEGIDFGLANDTEARQEALRKAVADARSKAEAIAGALGVKLAGVREVTEGGVSVVRPHFAEPRMMMAEAASTKTPVASGQLQISANVTIRYRLEP